MHQHYWPKNLVAKGLAVAKYSEPVFFLKKSWDLEPKTYTLGR